MESALCTRDVFLEVLFGALVFIFLSTVEVFPCPLASDIPRHHTTNCPPHIPQVFPKNCRTTSETALPTFKAPQVASQGPPEPINSDKQCNMPSTAAPHRPLYGTLGGLRVFPLERQYDPEAASEQTDGMNKRSEEGRGREGSRFRSICKQRGCALGRVTVCLAGCSVLFSLLFFLLSSSNCLFLHRQQHYYLTNDFAPQQ